MSTDAIEALRAMPLVETEGICYNLATANLSVREICHVESLMPSWPEASPSRMFPVPAPNSADVSKKIQSRLATKAFYSTENMWNPMCPYGAGRLRLRDYLIQRLEEETHDVPS